jgi:hypothetical protein
MLRITITTRSEGVTVVVEGRVAGPWADELARSWRALTATPDLGPICVQLDAVTFIDAAGKTLLRTMYEEGAAFAASGCMTRAILEEIGNDRRLLRSSRDGHAGASRRSPS